MLYILMIINISIKYIEVFAWLLNVTWKAKIYLHFIILLTFSKYFESMYKPKKVSLIEILLLLNKKNFETRN